MTWWKCCSIWSNKPKSTNINAASATTAVDRVPITETKKLPAITTASVALHSTVSHSLAHAPSSQASIKMSELKYFSDSFITPNLQSAPSKIDPGVISLPGSLDIMVPQFLSTRTLIQNNTLPPARPTLSPAIHETPPLENKEEDPQNAKPLFHSLVDTTSLYVFTNEVAEKNRTPPLVIPEEEDAPQEIIKEPVISKKLCDRHFSPTVFTFLPTDIIQQIRRGKLLTADFKPEQLQIYFQKATEEKLTMQKFIEQDKNESLSSASSSHQYESLEAKRKINQENKRESLKSIELPNQRKLSEGTIDRILKVSLYEEQMADKKQKQIAENDVYIAYKKRFLKFSEENARQMEEQAMAKEDLFVWRSVSS